MKSKLAYSVTILLVIAFCASLFLAPARQIDAAVLTPVSNNNGTNGLKNVVFFDGDITADTYSCFDLSQYHVLDVQYRIDQTVVNTTTLTIQRYNIAAGPTTPVYEAGNTVVSANAADAHGDLQVALFDRWTCVLADVTNSSAVTVQVFGLAK